jgi:hypothetical protein
MRRGEKMEIVSVDSPDARVQALRFGMHEGSNIECVTKIPAGPLVVRRGETLSPARSESTSAGSRSAAFATPASTTGRNDCMSDAHRHSPASTEARADSESIVLVGNPNVGKSVVFNALTGTYVDVSNFPGTTVLLARGRFGDHDVIDTPGVYGVSSFNAEETVARDIILDGDIVVNITDAVHLERDLFLTLQLVDMGKRMVVALNMADEARAQGVRIDRDLLEDLLGVPVIETVAVEGVGFDELKAAFARARAGHADVELEPALPR